MDAVGKAVSSATIRCSLECVNTSSWEINTSVLLRRHPWQWVSGFRPEVQHYLISIPFDGEHLFGLRSIP